jgi:hypothetical protein
MFFSEAVDRTLLFRGATPLSATKVPTRQPYFCLLDSILSLSLLWFLSSEGSTPSPLRHPDLIGRYQHTRAHSDFSALVENCRPGPARVDEMPRYWNAALLGCRAMRLVSATVRRVDGADYLSPSL